MSGNVNFDRGGSFRADILVAGALSPSNLECDGRRLAQQQPFKRTFGCSQF